MMMMNSISYPTASGLTCGCGQQYVAAGLSVSRARLLRWAQIFADYQLCNSLQAV